MANESNNGIEQIPSFDALIQQFANLETANAGGTEEQLFDQLNELRLWREMQQQKLTTNQMSQRQLLNLEKEKLYAMLGLSVNSDPNDSDASADDPYVTEDDGESGTEAIYTVNNAISDEHQHDESDSDEEAITPNTEIEMPIKQRATLSPLSKPKLPITMQEYPNAMETNDNNQIKKQPFLKRGEGLTNRFKISPDAYRLDRLPKYKYAKRVAQALSKRQPNKQKQQQQQSSRDGGSGRGEGQQLNSSRASSTSTTNNNNSKTKTPEVKNVNKNRRGKLFKHGPNELKLIPQKLVNNWEPTNDIADKTVNNDENVSHAKKEQDAANNLQIVNKINSENIAYPSTTPLFDTPIRNRVQAQHNEINELNIFELMEQRFANSIQSTPINKFNATEFIQTMADNKHSSTVGVQRTASIRPARCAVSQRSDPRIMKISAEADRGRDDEEQTSFYSSDEEPRHVHFASHAMRYVATDETTPTPDEACSVISESIIIPDDDENASMEPIAEPIATNDTPSTESFQRFKEKLFDRKLKQKFKTQLSVAKNTELVEVDEEVDNDNRSVFTNPAANYAPTDVQSQSHPILAAELRSKSDLLQNRLAELETEISTFREQNAELTKLIREHEVIRQEFEEERQSIHDQLNDERCKIEIYLHDENMKIVNERKELDRRTKELQRPNRTERDEMVKLREQVANHDKELGARDQKHISAQARLRAQLRNVEKEHKEIQFDLDNLRRENKKLETENARLRRQGNNKMLQEINRTIAKLAPIKQNTGENALNNNHEATDTRPSKVTAKVKGAKECSNRSAHRTVVAKVTSSSRSATPCTSADSRQMRSKSVPNLQDANDSDSVSEYELRNASDSDSADVNGHAKSSYFRSPQSAKFRQSSHSRENVTDRKSKSPGTTNESKGNNASHNDYKRIIENADGSKDVWYPNGNLKKISADAMFIRMMYYNKDIKETNISEGTVKYYYAETNTWHTTFMDGMEILEFPNGQNEHRLKDGTIEIYFPNGSVRITNPYKEKTEGIREEWKYLDGTTVIQKTNGDKLLMLPNGQREVHNNGHKRREYPDGTVKIVYPDGSQESRYANGRVRLKDKDGKLVMDSETIFV